MTVEEEKVESLLELLPSTIRVKYLKYIKEYHDFIYPASECPCREMFKRDGFRQLHFDLANLETAIEEVVQDIRFIINRRGPLIAQDNKGLLISRGKIAGVIAFRLSRRQIVHIDEYCLDFKKRCSIRCTMKMNTEFAVRCGTEFIRVQFQDIRELVQYELFYQLTTRHVNQETLGLIFDTIRLYHT